MTGPPLPLLLPPRPRQQPLQYTPVPAMSPRTQQQRPATASQTETPLPHSLLIPPFLSLSPLQQPHSKNKAALRSWRTSLVAGSRPLSVRSLADFALVTSPPRSSSPPAAAWFASPHPKVPARQPAARPAFPAHRLPATIISIPCPSYHYERAGPHEKQPPTAL